ncbi:phage tail protein [Gallibacterium anatis]|uniref:phage tail-collar fiber domain-containing protein n=1 Tax=Gallibacterium anatis TaxID=750 RepID=UPI0038B37330
MASKLTQAFETYIRDSVVNHTPVVFDEFIFANIPGLNDDNLDSHLTIPQANQIVHRQAVSQIGALNENAIVYSVTIGTEIGDFDFNWVGLVNKSQNLLACGIYTGLTSKIKNKEQKQGNSITRSVLLEFPRAQELANVSVSAETWQIDFTMRLSGIDEKIRLTNRDLYGRAVFFDNAFLLKRKSGNVYTLDSGCAYIEGVRAEIKRTAEVTVPALPASVYVDICHHATVTGAYQTEIKYLTQSKNDYVGSDGYQHYVQIIADIASDGTITDRRLTDNAPPYIAESKKSSSVSSTSKETVATSYAVKTAYDKAVAANNNADSRVSKSGGEMTGGLKLKSNYGASEKKWDYSGFYAGSATLNNEDLPYFQIHIGSYGGNTSGHAKSLGFDLINYKAYVMNWNSEGEYIGKKEILTELHRSDSVTSASSETVATSKAVKSANDNANGRVSKSGDTMTGKLTVSELNLSGQKLQFGDDYIYKRNNGASDAFVFFENATPSDSSKGNALLSFRGASALHYGNGSYVNQYNSKAPYFVEEDNSDVKNEYFPFLKGRVRRNSHWGAALSLGYVTNQATGSDGFGAGVVQLIEDNGNFYLWKFEHSGIFRSAGDVVTGSGVSLNGVNSKVDNLTNTVNGLKLTQNLAVTGWCRLPNGLLLQWGAGSGADKKQFPVAFRQVYQVVSSSTCRGDANYDLDLFFDNTHVWGRYQTNIRYFAIGE